MVKNSMFVVKQVDLGSLKLFFAKCEWNHKKSFFFRRKMLNRYADRYPLDNTVYPRRRNFIAMLDKRAQADDMTSSMSTSWDTQDIPWQLSWIADEIILDHKSRGWMHIEGNTWPQPEIVQQTLLSN